MKKLMIFLTACIVFCVILTACVKEIQTSTPSEDEWDANTTTWEEVIMHEDTIHEDVIQENRMYFENLMNRY